MSKSFRKKQKKYFAKDPTQKLLVQIDRIMKKIDDREDKALCGDIKRSFVRNGYLPKDTKITAYNLVKKYPEQAKALARQGRHYLYAVSDGENVKVGFATSVNRRLKEMQTGSSRELKVLWERYCGEDNKEAKKQEAKLHRALKRYHVRGEWFRAECMTVVRAWVVSSKDAKDEAIGLAENERLDAEFANIIG